MQRPITRLTAKGETDRLGFVRVVCPYPVVTTGISRALGDAGIPHGSRPPEAHVPHCVVLWTDSAEDLPEAVSSVREESPGAPVVVFGLRNDLPLARAALEAGARGFIHAGMQPNQIARALSVASKGEIAFPRGLLEFLLTEEGSSVDLDVLSARQREILEFVGEGFTNAQIAKRLFLSESTVKQHLRATYKLLGVKNRTEAAKLIRHAN